VTVGGVQELSVRVRAAAYVADDVLQLDLEPLDGVPCPTWAPGAHIDLVGPEHTRQYSLCGTDDDALRVAVLRVPDGRGGSAWVHEEVREGVELIVRGPRNHFELAGAEEYLFVAGGIGITPIIAMVREVDRRGQPWRLVYGGRTRSSMAYLDELEKYGDRVVVVPQDDCGFIDIDGELGEERSGRHVYCCGPEGLLLAVEQRMAARAAETLHVERFTADVDATGAAFEVVVASTGAVVPVADGESIIDALAGEGVLVESSCREGTCGTCETGVLEGVPDHRDSVLTAEERAANDCMMICVGRCVAGPLRLDL
jgi:ferredoxin-NADP reductase